MSASSASFFGRLVEPFIDTATFDFWASRINPAWSWSRPLARVVERRVEAENVITLVLAPNRHCGPVLPGQHINVSAEVNGRRITRSYSPSDVPRRDGRLALTVKRVEGGRLSTHLCREVQVGDVLEIGPAFGQMVWPAQVDGRWLMLAAGSGITPLMSLIREMASRGMPVEITLVYWTRTRAEVCFARELRDLARRFPTFTVHIALTREAAPLAGELQGRLQAEMLQRLAGDLTGQQVLACGPGGFVETARGLVAEKARSFQAEAFSPLPAAHPVIDDGATVRVVLRTSGRTLEVPSGQPLLDALEAQGLKPRYGCRMGICHTCVCNKHEGTTQNVTTGEQNAEPDTNVRLCVSRACTDITLDL